MTPATRPRPPPRHPRPAAGQAVDPIALEPVDEVAVTLLMDNVFDGLLERSEGIRRPPFTTGAAAAPQFLGGETHVGMRAEHGFSALVRVRRGDRTTTLLFDTGVTPDGIVVNADRLGLDLGEIGGVVMSHGHFDHSGGLAGLAARRPGGLPMTIHPRAWTQRRINRPHGAPRRAPDAVPQGPGG